MRSGIILAAALAACVTAGPASAQTYPQRAVKFILPFGPASGADITRGWSATSSRPAGASRW